MRRPSQPLILWQPKQPYFSTRNRPVFSPSALGTSTTPWWHFAHWDCVCPRAVMGWSQKWKPW